MKIKKSGWIFGGIILVVLLVFGMLWIFPTTKVLTDEELKAAALTKYPGEIIHAAKSGDEYEIEMQMENGIYAVRMDTKTGNILSLKQTSAKEVPPATDKVKEDPSTEIDSTESTNEAPITQENKLLTQQEVLIIAANYLKGVSDDDPELHHPTGQTPYYLVEVEIENGENDREAVVEVDAYTGAVKSVNWED
ncbi:PepSY domain-containing protein [Psychrobacillus sp. NPDC096623]|uniref:PepSY domain-containing protein n=1 Tax=Psychrobacillus sp. NPDC096623 TaxID=3364492 RepID=UPI0038263517